MILSSSIFASNASRLTYGDWNVSCTNADNCIASTRATGRTDALPYTFELRILRHGSPVEGLEVVFRFEQASPGETSPIILAIEDGPSFRFEPQSDYMADGDVYRLAPGPKVDKLTEGLVEGNKMYVTFVNPQLRETWVEMSLKGAREAIADILE